MTTSNKLLTSSNRRGIASLEFVLSLPFILAVAVIIASVGLMGLRKSEVVIHSRYVSWERRTDYAQQQKDAPPPNPKETGGSKLTLAYNKSNPLGVADLTRPTAGEMLATGSNNERLARWLVEERPPAANAPPSSRFFDVNAQSGCAVLMGTWDFHQVPFAGDMPHYDVLGQMASGLLDFDAAEVLKQFGKLLSLKALEALLPDEIRGIIDQVRGLMQGFAGVLKAATDAIKTAKDILDGADDIFGWIPGVGEGIDALKSGLNGATKMLTDAQDLLKQIPLK